MARTRRDVFITIRSEGALLPPDFLQQVAEGRDGIPGLSPEAYHLTGRERLNEAASRSWNRLLGVWAVFKAASTGLKETDPGIGMTREKWLLPLFHELGYGRLLPAKTCEVGGKLYPISHLWQHSPIHLVGCNVDLDRRSPGVAGAAKTSPHGLLQEFLNRSEHHLWGFLSNGLQLRILRNNKSLTRQAYIEFDLAGMMEGQVYADFALLWLLCHQSRVEAERPEQCWLERWSDVARQQGTRALDQLRDGVESAIEVLGRGFLAHGANSGLVERLRAGALSKQDYYRQLLRTVYRLIFLSVGEDRDLLLIARPGVRERERYMRYYSITRLRTLAERRRGSPHADLWRGQSLVLRKLSSDTGSPELGLPPLGSFLWSAQATPDLDVCELANADLLDAIRALAFTVDGGIRRVIDFRNLGPEELGSVYESLLELHPEVNADAATFSLTTAAGHERKTTGSYYTPTSLIECLLDSALDPVLEDAVKQTDPEKAILNLKVCDPACGSGHFLIAAGHRIATRLAMVRTGDEEPSPEAIRTALRDVVGRCLYGVDMNPMAVELCKVNLWLEALQPGKPLSFLDHHIQCGNSLIGATPALLREGIPDEAFEPIEGDDKALCREYKTRNRQERAGQGYLFIEDGQPWNRLDDFAANMMLVEHIDDGTIAGLRRKQQRYAEMVRGSDYRYGRLWADAWYAAFVWKKTREFPYPITEKVFRDIERNPYNVAPWMVEEIQRLAGQYNFFHWHLAFPEVFRVPAQDELPTNEQAGWIGGFDVVLGNPPWERLKIEEREWFERRAPEIASATTAAQRKRLIDALIKSEPQLLGQFQSAKRLADGQAKLISESGRFTLGAVGDLNTFSIFADLFRILMSVDGRAGFIAPTSLLTDYTYRSYFAHVMTNNLLRRVYDFANTREIFPAVDRNQKFSLVVLGLAGEGPIFSFGLLDPADAKDPAKQTVISLQDLRLVNPNTLNCPAFQSTKDAELVKEIYRRVPILQREGQDESNPWSLDTWTMFHMANDSDLFVEAIDGPTSGPGSSYGPSEYRRLYEGKTIQQFDHRFSHAGKPATALGIRGTADHLTDEDKADPNCLASTRYLVHYQAVDNRSKGYDWFIGYREIAGAVANIRTMAAAAIPQVAVGNKILLLGVRDPTIREISFCLLTNLNSFVLDYVLRQKLTGISLSFYIVKQLPILPSRAYLETCVWASSMLLSDWIRPYAIELSYTAWDLQPFALDCGWSGPPFRWDEERRFLLRCELDAALFHLYLPAEANGDWRPAEGETAEDLARLKAGFPTPRDAVAYIMDTFPIVKRKDEAKWGDYRTKRVILEIYDAMQEAIRTGQPYKTRLDPPPADPRCGHPPLERDRTTR